MYEFVSGPLALISFTIFFVGIITRIVWYIKGLDWRSHNRKPSVFYGCDISFPYMPCHSSDLSDGSCGADRRIVEYKLDYHT